MAQLMNNKGIYEFEVYPVSVLGNNFKQVEILGYIPYETALLLAGELEPIHAEIYSTNSLPVGTPNDPRQYNYYRIKKNNGDITILGEVWIDNSTIKEVSVKTAKITIPNASTTDVVRLREVFSQMGYKDYDIQFV